MSTIQQLSIDRHQLILQIERLAFRTWPATVAAAYEDWVFRAAQGVTKRANSVWTSAGNRLPKGDWMSASQAFYEAHGLPLQFHVSEASSSGLDEYLRQSGFGMEAPSAVLIAETETVAVNTADAAGLLHVTGKENPDPEWMDEFFHAESFDTAKRPLYEQVLSGIQPAKRFFSLYDNDNDNDNDSLQCVAVGTVVVDEGWAGVINVAVHPERRGQGIGRTLMHHLALWSMGQGANHMYLQVLESNTAAWKLYERAGFAPLYRYHYRTRH